MKRTRLNVVAASFVLAFLVAVHGSAATETESAQMPAVQKVDLGDY